MSSENQDQGDSAAKDPLKTIAVALEEQAGAAPAIVASGKGFLAEKILELAFANDVKVREDADLAQILAAIDVDSPIPTDAFAAVAEVLSYLYRANGEAVPDNLGDWPDQADDIASDGSESDGRNS